MTDYHEDFRLALAREMISEAREAAVKAGGGFTPCSDDNICPSDLTVTFAGITRENPVLVCTEQDGHEGDHVAKGIPSLAGYEEIARWARGTGRAG